MFSIGNLDDFDPYFDLGFDRVEDDCLCDDFDPYDHDYSMYCPSYKELEKSDSLPDFPIVFEDFDEDDPDDYHLLFI